MNQSTFFSSKKLTWDIQELMSNPKQNFQREKVSSSLQPFIIWER